MPKNSDMYRKCSAIPYVLDNFFRGFYGTLMNEPYRFINRKRRKNIYVMFEHLPGKEFSTGTSDMRKAIVFAETMLRKDWQDFEKDNEAITFSSFSRDFFKESDPHKYRKKNIAKNKNYDETFYTHHQSRLENYLLPRFGNYLLSSINKRQIDDWFLNLKAPNGKDLSANTKNKILFCLRIIMKTAVDEGVIASDPTSSIETFTENDTRNRQPFTKEELKVLFPKNENKLISTWGGLMWSVYFLVMRDTGWRPGEISGLKKENYYPAVHGIYTQNSVVNGVEKNSIKTSSSGKDYKVGFLSATTEKLFCKLLGSIKSDFLFITDEGNFVQPNAANKHLRGVAKRLKIDLKGRTQYSFRHSFETMLAGNVQTKALLELMAHTGFRPEYDHRTPEMILEQLSPVHETINKVFN